MGLMFLLRDKAPFSLSKSLTDLWVWCLRITPHKHRAEKLQQFKLLQNLPFFPFSLANHVPASQLSQLGM